MIENISKNLISLKQEFRRVYCGTSHVQEIMPLDESDDFPIPQNDLDSLHIFYKIIPFTMINLKQKLMMLTAWCTRVT